ncbi:flagellar brake protein [Candidatus Formimonas warabiya]|uniref:PilZ domain-containing protein n=1 Tax=Formimonas warabiya TaxID=1761012 RepID=A0A3G1KPA6_FORW1|nr:PilZ domain-containing protein [Candidatus Formimonas warabiya]ATW24303.1 hypothetical protein DCMF_05420 [Candidatus Formimonas warabiya]
MKKEFWRKGMSLSICLSILCTMDMAWADQESFDAFSKSLRDHLNGKQIFLDHPLLLLILAILFGGVVSISIYSAKKRKKVRELNTRLTGENPSAIPERFSYQVRKDEKRRWFRLPVHMDLIYSKSNAGLAPGSTDFITAPLIDLSAGGLLFMTREKLSIGDLLNLMIEFTDHQKFLLVGKVLRVAPNQNQDYPYQVGVQFVGIKEKEQDQIIKLLFQYQREQI